MTVGGAERGLVLVGAEPVDRGGIVASIAGVQQLVDVVTIDGASFVEERRPAHQVLRVGVETTAGPLGGGVVAHRAIVADHPRRQAEAILGLEIAGRETWKSGPIRGSRSGELETIEETLAHLLVVRLPHRALEHQADQDVAGVRVGVALAHREEGLGVEHELDQLARRQAGRGVAASAVHRGAERVEIDVVEQARAVGQQVAQRDGRAVGQPRIPVLRRQPVGETIVEAQLPFAAGRDRGGGDEGLADAPGEHPALDLHR